MGLFARCVVVILPNSNLYPVPTFPILGPWTLYLGPVAWSERGVQVSSQGGYALSFTQFTSLSAFTCPFEVFYVHRDGRYGVFVQGLTQSGNWAAKGEREPGRRRRAFEGQWRLASLRKQGPGSMASKPCCGSNLQEVHKTHPTGSAGRLPPFKGTSEVGGIYLGLGLKRIACYAAILFLS